MLLYIEDKYMNKKIISLGIVLSCTIPLLIGCSTNNDSSMLSILSDSEVYIYDFDDLESAISQREREISSGVRENTNHNQAILENTKMLKTWADEKGIDMVSR